MSTNSSEPIDQALFGYADGHRQIASSFRLPPKDLFLLSSASDLATGTRLSVNDSYVTGLPLPDSRMYAFFRTWAAPEMPRPGCVWSHALLLSPRVMASLSAFSELLPLFRRPMAQETSVYAEQLEFTTSDSTDPADVRPISRIIQSYYAGRHTSLPSEDQDRDVIERAVLAVWSQQWPRLRAGFSFCTASLNDGKRTDSNDYDVQVVGSVPAPSSDWQPWLLLSAADAAKNKVTPLRRFLWRYGRDLANSRRHYRMLVELFERSTNTDEISAEVAAIVFQSLPDPTDGAVLKRDIIGIGSTSPRLTAVISAVDLLKLLTSGALPEEPTPSQVGQRLGELMPSQIGTVARYYDSHREKLAPWRESIVNAIVTLADKASIEAEDFPETMFEEVLLTRQDLVDTTLLQRLRSDALETILRSDASQDVIELVISEMVRRDLGNLEDRIVAEWPTVVLRCAIEAFSAGDLGQSWLRSIPRNSAAILGTDWLGIAHSTKDIAVALAILRFPRKLMKTADELTRRLFELSDDAAGPDRTNMQAALLRAAIDEASADSWQLISRVLPELRTVVLHGNLPPAAYNLLSSDLPHFYSAAHWDLNKRILLSLSKLHRNFPNDTVLRTLLLSDSEIDFVISGEAENSKRYSLFRLFDWP